MLQNRAITKLTLHRWVVVHLILLELQFETCNYLMDINVLTLDNNVLFTDKNVYNTDKNVHISYIIYLALSILYYLSIYVRKRFPHLHEKYFNHK